MSMTAIKDMREHVIKLCQQWGIVTNWCDRPSKAWAAPALQEIGFAPIKSAISYVTALHEIGHVRGHYQRSRHRMVRERWAWRWARANALIWTPVMDRARQRSIALYERRIKNGQVPALCHDTEK
jgi:hypothetical protein